MGILTQQIIVLEPACCCSAAQSCLTPCTVARQALLFMGLPRQEYWSGFPFPSPGGSSRLREWTQVSCISRQILYHWVPGKAPYKPAKDEAPMGRVPPALSFLSLLHNPCGLHPTLQRAEKKEDQKMAHILLVKYMPVQPHWAYWLQPFLFAWSAGQLSRTKRPPQWTWVWRNSRRQWRTGKPGVLQSMGLQRVRHDWETEKQQKDIHSPWKLAIESITAIMWFSCLQYCLQGRRGWENTSTARLWGIEMKGNVAKPVRHFVTPRTIQSMGFSRPEYWSGQPFPSPGDLPTQGLNPCLPHCKQILYQLSHKRSPRILGWVVCIFSGGSSRPRNQTKVSCIAGRFFTNWAVREALRG